MTTAHCVALDEAIRFELDRTPGLDSSQIAVTVHEDVATLAGSVHSYLDKLAAEHAALSVSGVRGVANDLDVKPAVERLDADIAREAIDALRKNPNVPTSVQISVRDGCVEIEGTAEWDAECACAVATVAGIAGVRSVANGVVVKPAAASCPLPPVARTQDVRPSTVATSPKQAQVFIQDERDSASLYDTLASLESDARLATVYRKLAETERRHADHWIKKLQDEHVTVPPHRLGWRTRVLAWTARRLGAAAVVSVIAGQEQADARRYAGTSDRAPGMDADERGHATLLQAIAGNAGIEGPMLARIEGRHRSTGGNALRAAVLGANDGLVSNLSLVTGVAGASLAGKDIVIAGIAGLLAGAGSMALGEWLSVLSSRELYEKQIGIEQAEIASNPEEEIEELALIYQAKGLPAEQAKAIASGLMKDDRAALDTLAREELGIDPKELGGSAMQAAVTSFLLFALGAIIPLWPYLVFSPHTATGASLGASALGLFGIGAAITVLTGRSAWFSGLRQVAVGIGAAGLTYLIGHLIGVALT